MSPPRPHPTAALSPPGAAESSASSAANARDFNVLWSGLALSYLGTALSVVAVPLLVFEATHSVAKMGLLTGLNRAGGLVTMAIAGALADRMDPRRMMIAADLAQMTATLAVCACWWLIGPTTSVLFVCVILGGLLQGPFSVGYQKLLKTLVAPGRLTEANSRIDSTFAVSLVIGPVLAGAVCARFGPAWAIGLDGLTFAASAVATAILRVRPQETTRERRRVLAELGDGLRFLARNRLLRAGIGVMAGIGFVDGAVYDLFIFRLRQELQQSEQVIGITLGAASVGAVVGAKLVPRLQRRLGLGATVLGGFALCAVALCGSSATSSTPIVALCAALFMCGRFGGGVAWGALRQETTPHEYVGRVTAGAWLMTQSLVPLGAAAMTQLAERTTSRTAFAVMGGLTWLLILLGLAGPLSKARGPVAGAPA
ncbi:MFS transporter [Sorangium sp. So ce1182]|uniref:MFS transporter n=1 Tax=Sorangium sp. So ce1182 TaxID=3133334 RepID=UPI003F6130BF